LAKSKSFCLKYFEVFCFFISSFFTINGLFLGCKNFTFFFFFLTIFNFSCFSISSFLTINGLFLGIKNFIFFSFFSTIFNFSCFSSILASFGLDFGFKISLTIFLSDYFLSNIGFFKGIIVNSTEKILLVDMKKNINIFIKKDIFLSINFTK